MIALNNLTMGFSNRTLFENVSLSIFPNEKIGLTGPNGAGKTTLFSIILGDCQPVEGQVQIQKNINIGYLPQEAKFDSKRTVMEEMTAGDDRIRKLLDEKHKLEDEHKADSHRYGDILEELELLGVYEIEHKAEKILTGLGFKEEDFHKPIMELSGGWQMRTLLAKLLTYPYNLLLLDEPTNYLDLPATLWLKGFLSGYDGAFVLISHDRVFLNDITNYTIILEDNKMTKLKGNYAFYEKQREMENKSLEKRQKVVEKKRQQLERFAERFHAQPNRAAAVRNKRRMIDKLENITITKEKESIQDFEFADIPASGHVVATLDNVSKSYGEKQVYKDLDFEIVRGQKVCLVGPNGAGKSTLLKMLAGAIEPNNGAVKYGHKVDKGYFSQTRTDVLSPNNTAFDEVMLSALGGTSAVQIRSLLALFNFYGDDVFKHVKVLSGGEKSRLILAKLLINPPNFMLLDEPTTHLDMDGVKALTAAFKKYTGTICLISHDLYFIKEIADQIVEVDSGQLNTYMGGLDYYLDKKQGKAVEVKEQKRVEKRREKKAHTNEEKTNSTIDQLHDKHKQALKRVKEIKNKIKSLDQERDALEKENYVKSRILSKDFDMRDKETLKEYGIRMKDIQTRLRAIESEIKSLEDERKRISR